MLPPFLSRYHIEHATVTRRPAKRMEYNKGPQGLASAISPCSRNQARARLRLESTGLAAPLAQAAEMQVADYHGEAMLCREPPLVACSSE
jgi:hypothetical protein